MASFDASSTWMAWKPVAMAAVIMTCLSMCGCAAVIESLLETREEARQKQQNPALLIEQIEEERRYENAQDIQRQDLKEEAAKKKQFDEMLEKQLRKQLPN